MNSKRPKSDSVSSKWTKVEPKLFKNDQKLTSKDLKINQKWTKKRPKNKLKNQNELIRDPNGPKLDLKRP